MISASEIQHFEQTYESWASEMIRNINPKLKFTVIAKVEFSQNPEQLETYDDMKAAQHLPGLPEIADPGYTHPMDSPLFALVSKKSLKIIFHSSMNSNEKRVVDEVIRAKMKFNGTDSLAYESMESNPVSDLPNSRKRAMAILSLILGAGILAGALSGRKPKNSKKAHRITLNSNPPVLPASHRILNAKPAIRRQTLRHERAETIAKASLHCSLRFSNELLGELDQGKFDEVNQWILQNRTHTNKNEAEFARILIAANIQQNQNSKLIDTLNRVKAGPGLQNEASL
jgi:hypothetical protein